MVNKRLTRGYSKIQILRHGVKRYGSYLLLSLFLCVFCFEGLKTFLSLNEILGTISVYALVSLGLLLVFYSKEWLFIPFGIAMAIPYLTLTFTGLHYPFYIVLPFFLFGVYFGKVLKERNKRKGLILLLVMVGLLPFFREISYKSHTFGFALLNTAIIIILFGLAEKFRNRIPKALSEIGKHTLFLYVFHFAVLFKLAEALGVYQSLNTIWAGIVTLLGLSVAFVLCYVVTRPKDF